MCAECQHENTKCVRMLDGSIAIICWDCREECIPSQPGAATEAKSYYLDDNGYRNASNCCAACVHYRGYGQPCPDGCCELMYCKDVPEDCATLVRADKVCNCFDADEALENAVKTVREIEDDN